MAVAHAAFYRHSFGDWFLSKKGMTFTHFNEGLRQQKVLNKECKNILFQQSVQFVQSVSRTSLKVSCAL